MTIKTGRGTIPLMTLIAVWSISAVISLPGLAVSPILGKLHLIFPSVSQLEIQMLSTLPSLLIIPAMLVSGQLSVGHNKFKLLLWGLSLFFGSGILYFFAHTMTQLIIISCVLGVGAGIMLPLSTGYIVDYFSGEYRVRQLGLSSAINNMTLVLATALTGYLAEINWHYPFAVYLIPGVAILLSGYIRRSPPPPLSPLPPVSPLFPSSSPSSSSSPSGEMHTANRDAKRTKRFEGVAMDRLGGLILLYFFITYAVVVVLLYLPFLMQDYKMSSGTVGVMISIFCLAIMLPGFFLNPIVRVLKGYTNVVSMGSIVLGLLMFCLFRERALIALGAFMSGFGYGVMQPIIYDKAASVATASKATFSLSVVMTANNLAIILCPLIADSVTHIIGTHSPLAPFILNVIAAAAVMLFAFSRRRGFIMGVGENYYAR